MEKIQHLCHIFILHVHYRVKNKKKTRITMLEYMFFNMVNFNN